VALWVLVAALALSAATGVAAADSHADVERSGDTVTVTVPASSFDGNQSAVVLVDGEEAARYTPTFDGGNNTTSLAIQRFSDRPGSLASANVTVTNGSATLVSETVTLQYVESDGNATLTVRDDGSYVVLPVDPATAVGLEPAESVAVDVSNGTTNGSVDGTYTDGEVLVPVADLRPHVSVFDNVTLEPLASHSEARYDLTPSAVATATLSPGPNATVLTHPLVFSDTSYTVEVTTDDPEGTYSQRLSPETDGRFSLPESLFYAESISVSISGPNGDLLDGSDGAFATSDDVETANATWYGANATLAVDEEFPPNLVTVWIRDNGTVSTATVDLDNASAQRLNLTGTGIAPGGNATALLVGDETLRVTDISVVAANNTTQGATNQSMTTGILGTLGDNISIIATLLLTPLVGLITFKVTQGVNNIDTTKLTVGVVAVVFGIGSAVWLTADLAGLGIFLLFAVVVAAIQILVWLELSQKREFDSLISAGIGCVPAGLVVGILAGVKLVALEPDSALRAFIKLGGAGYGLLAAAIWTGTASVVGGSTTGSAGPPTYDTTVRLEDETGSLISGKTQVTLTRGQGLEGSQTETITGGSATVPLRQGDWTAKATQNGQTVRAQTQVHRGGQRLTLQFSGRAVRLTVVDKETRAQIPDATLSVTVDGERQRHTPNQNGRWEETFPRSADSISVTVTHDRYEEVTISRSLQEDINGTVQLTPLKGTLVASVTVDGRGVGDIPVELTPTDTALSDGFSDTTDASGEVTFEDVRIGTYRAAPSLTDKPTEFSADDVSVRISEGQRTRETLPVRFDYELTGDHRRRIRDLRDRASDIATVSRRDGAIPSFYASVLHELLDTTEAIPTQAQPLLVAGIAPDRVVEAMLSAVEKAADTVDDVMSSKRNVDLFAACTDLPSASVTWNGEASIERLLELSTQESGQQREGLTDQVEQAEDRIATERSDVAEISPAQEMLEAVRTMVRDSATLSQVDSAALVVAASALLDAIESLFDRTQLRERMERTVY